MYKVLAIFVALSTTCLAEQLPVPDNAKIFYQEIDEKPFVVNYFSAMTENEITNFYQSKFGQAVNQQHKRGRLELVFKNNDDEIRVIVSPQSKHNEVSVMQIKNPAS